MKREWREFKDGYYVSNYGEVRHKLKNKTKLLNPYDSGGYKRVDIHGKAYRVHRMVAECFIPKIDGKNHINHRDHNRANNRVDNLEWCTQAENNRYSAHLKRHLYSKSTTNTGERYITSYFNDYGNKRYKVALKSKAKVFKNLEDAVEYRNRRLNEINSIQ